MRFAHSALASQGIRFAWPSPVPLKLDAISREKLRVRLAGGLGCACVAELLRETYGINRTLNPTTFDAAHCTRMERGRYRTSWYYQRFCSSGG